MANDFNIKMYAYTVDCKDPNELAKFYADLLKWEIVFSDDEFVCTAPPGTRQGEYPGIMFQRNPQYKPPVWPDEPEAQQQMAHIDVAVDDLEKAAEHAIQCGATVSEKQFSDYWRVMFDPAGHPFCLCLMKHLFAEE